MVRVGIAELKAQLSHYLAVTKAGEEVLITDRGRPVAKLSPLGPRDTDVPSHLLEMERRGEVKMGAGRMPDEVRERPRPRVKRGYSGVEAVNEERRQGR